MPQRRSSRKRNSKIRNDLPPKYELYEAAVLDSEHDLKVISKIFRELRGHYPLSLREDFAGTFRTSYEWVKMGAKNTALALDIDSEPLTYGKNHYLIRLSSEAQKRLTASRGNVLQITKPGVDFLMALNFSYFIFKERPLLKRYFENVYASLKRDGVFFMDVVGGFDMMKPSIDKKKIEFRKKESFTYIWQQKNYNPISHEADFKIEFRLPNGKKHPAHFDYPWRLWGIRELRDLLDEVGFRNSYVYWEGDDKNGEGNGIFTRKETEENCEVWIAYVVGAK